MKYFLQVSFTIIFASLLMISCLAQTNLTSSIPQAQKFDEFVFDYDSYKERVHRFAEALSKESTAKAYIIAYDKRVSQYQGLHSGYSSFYVTNYLKYENDYKISEKRIIIIGGGMREKLDVELFIVPIGAALPIPTQTLSPDKEVKCPRLRYVSAPSFVFANSNYSLIFTASVGSDTPEIKPIYKWSVSEGKIISGQGTSSIKVERPIPNYRAITATVEIDGYSRECKLEKRTEASPQELINLPMKFEEFPRLNCEEEENRFKYFYQAIISDPKVQGYIILYTGKEGKRNEIKAMKSRFINGHYKFVGALPKQIPIIDGGFREQSSIEFWLMEKGKGSPTPTPTVDIKDVRLKGFERIYKNPCLI